MTTRQQTAVSVGFTREDGSFQVIATLNNNDDLFNCKLETIIAILVATIAAATDRTDIVMIERQDAPDYIDTL